jgi:hypothetical protein
MRIGSSLIHRAQDNMSEPDGPRAGGPVPVALAGVEGALAPTKPLRMFRAARSPSRYATEHLALIVPTSLCSSQVSGQEHTKKQAYTKESKEEEERKKKKEEEENEENEEEEIEEEEIEEEEIEEERRRRKRRRRKKK